jgi:hypothetical protein
VDAAAQTGGLPDFALPLSPRTRPKLCQGPLCRPERKGLSDAVPCPKVDQGRAGGAAESVQDRHRSERRLRSWPLQRPLIGRKTVSARTGIPGVYFQKSVSESGSASSEAVAPSAGKARKPGLFAPKGEKDLYKAVRSQDAGVVVSRRVTQRSNVVCAAAGSLIPVLPRSSYVGGKRCALLRRLRVWISTRSRRHSWSVCTRVWYGSHRWTNPSSPRWLSRCWPATSSARADNGFSRKAGRASGTTVRSCPMRPRTW